MNRVSFDIPCMQARVEVDPPQSSKPPERVPIVTSFTALRGAEPETPKEGSMMIFGIPVFQLTPELAARIRGQLSEKESR